MARQMLNICIRALDYCPPVDILGEYLRALITADRDLVPEDERSYRVAFICVPRSGHLSDRRSPSLGRQLGLGAAACR